jgi:hypothetical protein
MMALAQRGRDIDQQRAMLLKERNQMFKRSGATRDIFLDRLVLLAVGLPTIVSFLSVIG